MNTEQSSKWRLNYSDVKKWLRNAWVFLAPVVLLYTAFVAANINQDGFQLSDFAINNVVLGAMILYVLNTITDLARKVSAGPTK